MFSISSTSLYNAWSYLVGSAIDVNDDDQSPIEKLFDVLEHGEIKAFRSMLSKYADIDLCERNAGDKTLLHVAAMKGKHEAIEALLKMSGADIDIDTCTDRRDVEGPHLTDVTPLMLAAQYGHADAVRVLIAAGANIEAMNSMQYSVLMHAICFNKPDIVDILLAAGARVDGITPPTETLLGAAATYAEGGVLTALIHAGADVNATNSNGDTPLMAAARYHTEDSVKALIRAGASVNAVNHAGDTALILAAGNGRARAVGALMKANANINAINHVGDTPLIVACRFDYVAAVNALPAPHDYASAYEWDRQAADIPLRPQRIVRALVHAYEDVIYTTNDAGQTGIMAAASVGNSSVITELIEAGADVHAVDNQGRTAVNYALDRGNLAVTNQLHHWMDRIEPRVTMHSA